MAHARARVFIIFIMKDIYGEEAARSAAYDIIIFKGAHDFSPLFFLLKCARRFARDARFAQKQKRREAKRKI